MLQIIALVSCLCFSLTVCAEFEFTFEPIDVVIPCHAKDKATLDLVIDGIRKNIKNVRRIIVVSATPLIEKAEWFDEHRFPFDKQTIAQEIFQDGQLAQDFLHSSEAVMGWIFQQFIKVYSMLVIPDISQNLLIIDADTIFLQPVSFQDPATGAGLYNPGKEHYRPYFAHIAKVLPSCKKVFTDYSGISHHMLLQKSVVEALFAEIVNIHGKEPWKVFCEMVDIQELHGSCMSVDYELYFNFVFGRSNLVKIRLLNWKNVPLVRFNAFKDKNFDYLSCHSYL